MIHIITSRFYKGKNYLHKLNYLHNRTQVVEFQGVSSIAEPVSVVVP